VSVLEFASVGSLEKILDTWQQLRHTAIPRCQALQCRPSL